MFLVAYKDTFLVSYYSCYKLLIVDFACSFTKNVL